MSDQNTPNGPGLPNVPSTPGSGTPTPTPPVPAEPPMDDSQMMVIRPEDLASADVDRRVNDMIEARKVALVREIGTLPDIGAKATLTSIAILTAGGLVGGVIAFALVRVIFETSLFEDNSAAGNVSFTFLLAFAIGVSVALADVVASRSWSKLVRVAAITIPAALGAGLLIGIIAHLFYSAGIDWLIENASAAALRDDLTPEEFNDYITLRLHPIRGVAWLFVGVAAGIAAGVAARSWKRLGIAAAGGAVGGFLGGFVFDFFPQDLEWAAQLFGIALLGLLIGLATGLVEQAAKSRWIEIVTGGLAGKPFILYKSTITLGSSPQADVTLIKDAMIAPVAAELSLRTGSAKVRSTSVDLPIFVNAQPVKDATLTDNDVITLGSTQVRFRERSSKTRVPARLPPTLPTAHRPQQF